MKRMLSQSILLSELLMASRAEAAGAPHFTLDQALMPATVGAVFCLIMLIMGRLRPMVFVLIFGSLAGTLICATKELSWIASAAGLGIAVVAFASLLTGSSSHEAQRSTAS